MSCIQLLLSKPRSLSLTKIHQKKPLGPQFLSSSFLVKIYIDMPNRGVWGNYSVFLSNSHIPSKPSIHAPRSIFVAQKKLPQEEAEETLQGSLSRGFGRHLPTVPCVFWFLFCKFVLSLFLSFSCFSASLPSGQITAAPGPNASSHLPHAWPCEALGTNLSPGPAWKMIQERSARQAIAKILVQ